MSKEKTVECFVPAMALQHYTNGETFNLHQKLCAAVLRLFYTGNFIDLFSIQDPIPNVFLSKIDFKPHPLGYNIIAKIY